MLYSILNNVIFSETTKTACRTSCCNYFQHRVVHTAFVFKDTVQILKIDPRFDSSITVHFLRNILSHALLLAVIQPLFMQKYTNTEYFALMVERLVSRCKTLMLGAIRLSKKRFVLIDKKEKNIGVSKSIDITVVLFYGADGPFRKKSCVFVPHKLH